MASRNASYKMKPSAMDKREKRIMRVHRRSIDQREMRLDEVNKRRHLSDNMNMSPVLESKDGSKQPSRIGTPNSYQKLEKAALSRLEKLKKWKEEKELKKKLESMEKARNKPGFKIGQLSHNDNILYKKGTANKPSECNGKPQRVAQPRQAQQPCVAKPMAKPATSSSVAKVFVKKVETTVKQPQVMTKRTASPATRPSHRLKTAVASPKAKAMKKLPLKGNIDLPRAGKRNLITPASASKTRSASAKNEKIADTKKLPTKRGANKNMTKPSSQPEDHAGNVGEPSLARVSTRRGDHSEAGEPSFAPSDFVFEAPSNVPSFIFRPLSPASAAGFLFPNGSTSTFSGFNDSVESTSTPKKSKNANQQEYCEGNNKQVSSTANVACDNKLKQTEEETSKSCEEESPPTHHTTLPATCTKHPDFPDETNIEELSAIGKEMLRSSQSISDKAVPLINTTADSKPTARMATVPQTSDSGMGMSPNDCEAQSPVFTSQVGDSGTDENNDDVFCADGHKSSGKMTDVEPSTEQSAKSAREKSNFVHPEAALSEKHCQENKEHLPAADTPADLLPEPNLEKRTTRSRSRSFRALALSLEDVKNADGCIKTQMNSGCSHKTAVRFGESSSLETTSVSREKDGPFQPVSQESKVTVDAMQCENQQKPLASLDIQSESLGREENQPLAANHANSSTGHKTPLRQSRRSVARAKAELAECENGEGEQSLLSLDMKVTPCRRRRSSAMKVGSVAKVDPIVTDRTETGASLEKRRRSKRLSAAILEPSPQSGLEELTVKQTASESVAATMATPVLSSPHPCMKEMDVNEGTDKSCPAKDSDSALKSTYLLRQRRSTTFLTPGPPLSARRSKTKRRRTETMIALAAARSPEEAIKIISVSPMIEMTRRTPKSKLSPELRKDITACLFEDRDLLQGPKQLFHEDTDTENTFSNAGKKIEGTTDIALETQGEADSILEKRDVSYFRSLWALEVNRLTKLADKWEGIGEITSGLSEEVQGEIRTTVCQARLLMKQKLQQFSGLVDCCESGDPRTTCQDLQGFWDMVYMQVEDVDTKFHRLDKLQLNNWKPEEVVPKVNRQKGKKATIKKEASKVVKPTGRSKFAAFKAELAKQSKAPDCPAGSQEEKVFDAGFFKVSSPIRTPHKHCEALTPSKLEAQIPQNTSREESCAALVLSPHSSKDDGGRLAQASDNKENLAHVLLRRSIGEAQGRHSYSPAVPSPLLHDSTPRRNSSESGKKPQRRSLYRQKGRAEAESSDGGTSNKDPCEIKAEDKGKAQSLRRSSRTRKSVSFAEAENKLPHNDPVDFMAYFQPSSVTCADSPHQISSLESSPFSLDSILVQSDASARNTPAANRKSCTPAAGLVSGGRQRSCLKKLPSVERRKSRRSVSFVASPVESSCRNPLPSTPYNRNSLVANTRVLRHSAAYDSPVGVCPLEELKDLEQMPKLRRSTRPSLLYTPPQQTGSSQQTPRADIPVDTLVDFTP